MYGRPAASPQRRSRAPLLISLAALAALALALPGAIGENVLASRAIPRPVAVGDVAAESTPTPTPSLIPDGSPTPDATSTPTPLPVGTPFFSAPEESAAEIVAEKIIDADGNLDTEDDQSPGEGWEMIIGTENLTFDSSEAITNASGLAAWEVRFGPDGGEASLLEVAQENFELLDAFCIETTESGDNLVAELDGDSVTFEVDEHNATYHCSFFNAPILDVGTVTVSKVIDHDGDLTSGGDVEFRPWEITAEFGDAEVLTFVPSGDSSTASFWEIRFLQDSTPVVLTEVPQDGFLLADAFCVDIWTEQRVSSRLDGLSLNWEAVIDRADFLTGAYECIFINVPTGVVRGETPVPTVTLPPTHAATGSAALGSDEWRFVLVGLAALIASVLVLRSHSAARNRR